MKLLFTPNGWQDYVSWLPGESRTGDAAVLASLNRLLMAMMRDPFKGIGKPEPLRGEFAGRWSRRLTQQHRVVCRVRGTGGDQLIEVATCRGHY